MERIRVALRDKFIHLYAWLGAIPGTFLVLVIVLYVQDGEGTSFMDTVKEVLANKWLMAFMIPWSIVSGYLEAWYVRKKLNKKSIQTHSGSMDSV